MALVFPGKTKCLLCGNTIFPEDRYVAFPAFLPVSHSLHFYSDGVFHSDCYDNWDKKDKFDELYDRYRKIWESRPRDLKTVEEMDAWVATAFQDFSKEDV